MKVNNSGGEKVVRHLAVGTLLAAAAIAGAGCGSSDSSGGSGSSTNAGGGSASAATSGINVQQAKQDLSAVVGGGDQITLPKLDAVPPKGKTLSFVNCPLPICTEVGQGVKQAADALGWRVRNVMTNATPSGYKQGWQQIAQNPGNGVVNSASVLPDAAVASLMKQAGVPSVSVTSPSDPGQHTIAVIDSRPAIQRQGAAEGNWVVQDSGKPVKTLFVYDPSIQSIATAWNGYSEALAKNCPKCSAHELKVSVAKIGPALAQEVVSYLQSNPDVGYVVFGLGDLATGVPAAIRAAGLAGKVKVVVRAATPPNLQDVKNGAIAAAFTDEIYEAAWRAVDVIVRQMAGTPVGEKTPFGKVRLITKDNLPPDLSKPYTVPDYQTAFKQAWGIS
jgi:ribose transport system substrate-binding protein